MATDPTTSPRAQALIVRLALLPESFAALEAEALAEGFEDIRKVGEGLAPPRAALLRSDGRLLGAFIGSKLVGIGGIMADPYLDDPRVGRIRHLYVSRDVRGAGVGHDLVTHLLMFGRERFDRVRLRAEDPQADRFHLRLGFRPTTEPDATHVFVYRPGEAGKG